MPPKKKVDAASKKTEQKKKEKIIEDKTFGLKNKKGAKQQKFITQVQHQVKHSGQSKEKLEAEKHDARKKKAAGVDELEDLNKLLKPVQDMPKVSKDVDPKSVLCAFFKQGMCTKGGKCKYSHDLAVERKAEKRNIYVDNRDEDTMANWDEAKLSEVVEKKHGEAEKLKPKTAIICKFFLEALEESKYGWFWECPNGEKCIYRHALPPGYVLKKDKKKMDEMKEAEISLEDLIEKERAALGSNLTKVSLESFLAWKKRKLREKKEKKAALESKKKTEFKAGRAVGLSGKDLFTFNPDLITQDDEEADDTRYIPTKNQEEGEEGEGGVEEEEGVEIDESMFLMEEMDDLPDEEEDDTPSTTTTHHTPAQNGTLKINEDLFNVDQVPEIDEDGDSPGGKANLSDRIGNLVIGSEKT